MTILLWISSIIKVLLFLFCVNKTKCVSVFSAVLFINMKLIRNWQIIGLDVHQCVLLERKHLRKHWNKTCNLKMIICKVLYLLVICTFLLTLYFFFSASRPSWSWIVFSFCVCVSILINYFFLIHLSSYQV